MSFIAYLMRQESLWIMVAVDKVRWYTWKRKFDITDIGWSITITWKSMTNRTDSEHQSTMICGEYWTLKVFGKARNDDDDDDCCILARHMTMMAVF